MLALVLLLTSLTPLFLIGPPAPAVASEPLPNTTLETSLVVVDFMIVNQYCEVLTTEVGTPPKSRVVWYTSFWRVHWFGYGLCQIPVWENCGWEKSQPLVQCDGGFCSAGEITIVARQIFYVCSDYDFEYRNRAWFNPIRK